MCTAAPSSCCLAALCGLWCLDDKARWVFLLARRCIGPRDSVLWPHHLHRPHSVPCGCPSGLWGLLICRCAALGGSDVAAVTGGAAVEGQAPTATGRRHVRARAGAARGHSGAGALDRDVAKLQDWKGRACLLLSDAPWRQSGCCSGLVECGRGWVAHAAASAATLAQPIEVVLWLSLGTMARHLCQCAVRTILLVSYNGSMPLCRSAGSGDGAHWRQRCMLANLCRGPECPRACRPIAIHSLVQPPGLEVLFSRGCWGPVLVVQRSSQPAPQETSLCIQYSRPTNMLQGKQATIIVEVAVW